MITPLGSHIVIKRSPVEQTSRGGIVLPDTGKVKPKEGTVLAVGPGRVLKGARRQQMEVSIGDRVLFNSYAGTDLRVAGDELVVIEEHDVLAKLVAE
jgi:chaperonin GroES